MTEQNAGCPAHAEKRQSIWVLGEALMDCVLQADGSFKAHLGGSPFNLARAAALRGGEVTYVTPLSADVFGMQLQEQLNADGVRTILPPTRLPTSLAVIQLRNGQPQYGFYREGIADRNFDASLILRLMAQHPPGILHTGSLFLVPPDHEKVLEIILGAKKLGWIISVDANLRPKVAADLVSYVAAVREVCRHADWLKASDEDLALLGYAAPTRRNAPDIAGQFKIAGVSRIALTFGGQGAWLAVGNHCADQDVPVVEVVDTVGAGDTFWGNCLADWSLELDGAHTRVERTLHDAMLAAAINCARAGCMPPKYEELQRQ